MVRINTNFWRLFRQSTATGLVLLLAMAEFAPVAEAGEWIRRDWSKVQRIASGARTRVLLYKDRAPGGIRKVEGQFQLASAEAIMLLLPAGQTLTLRKQAVEKVLVYRPIEKRYQGWITAGVMGGIVAGAAAKGKDASEPPPAWLAAALVALVVGVPTVVVFLVAPKWGGVYNVPRKLRDDPVPTPSPPPAKQSSNTTDAGVTEHTGAGSGDRFLNGKSAPELPRWQARRALMRQDLPLDLSGLPVHVYRSSID